MNPEGYTVSMTPKIRFISLSLVVFVIILASLLIDEVQKTTSLTLPYTEGSIVTPATEMPAGMVVMTYPASPTSTPTIGLQITKDSMGGWDVFAPTTNFTFSPEHLNGAPVQGEGHIHLYIDNYLIIMLSPWYHIDSLSKGTHVIKVGLFNNDHSAYQINGVQIEATTTVVGP